MSDFEFRRAGAGDVPAIVDLLADDTLGATRESAADLSPYEKAFALIDADPNQHLIVAERDGRIVGTLQLTVTPGLSLKGSTRATIEGVRVDSSQRGAGLGTRFIEWAIDEARRLDCHLVQLTSNAAREDAHRFYERLGFVGSHRGFKYQL